MVVDLISRRKIRIHKHTQIYQDHFEVSLRYIIRKLLGKWDQNLVAEFLGPKQVNLSVMVDVQPS